MSRAGENFSPKAVRPLGVSWWRRDALHPKLEAYCRAELPADEEEAIREHLADCPEDAELVRDFLLLSEDPSEDEPEDEGEVDLEASRRRLEVRWQGEQARLRAERKRYLVAAAAVISMLSLVALTSFRYGRSGALDPPTLTAQVNIPERSLMPVDSLRSAPAEPDRVSLPEEGTELRLVLRPNGLFPPGASSLQLLDLEGKRLWQSDPRPPTERGEFTINVRRGWAEAGRYELRVVGSDGKAAARYPLELVDGSL